MTKRCAIKTTVFVFLLLAGGLSIWWGFQNTGQRARRAWKNEALPKIKKMSDDMVWVTREIEKLKDDNHPQIFEAGWLTDRLILMANGEWLVYESHCSKDKPHLVSDIFLAKGSNGKWYYSTFHFCVGMVALCMEQESAPPDLSMFVTEYNLQEFDGSSDECLQPTGTWPASWKKNSHNIQSP